ncbi:MoaD/ThiS family protein [Novosphingobium album (ex Liu et al. 2023)]|uniref:MoaD/ThiS family protein n=1 Tax=Novosphingobium album (ex Liu et al. 2023) TaxID=3031130 RepID=A0ABT5WSB5_9SPHN|nr:MoaD/ThiS family protein [Novosphingobium album (ex Liu et al. 2023)]MDE8652939.1 MoaD/ThiS family protein [Novosphingobium album (ex Liu et al. 2023)]
MPLKLVFLGRLEDVAGAPDREVAGADSIEGVLAALEPELAAALREPRIRLAVNGVLLAGGDAPALSHGDEIAFLPPVSGG